MFKFTLKRYKDYLKVGNIFNFLKVGKSLGASILDLTAQNPCSRLPNSEFHSLSGLRDWLRSMSNEFHCHNRPKMRARGNTAGLQSQVGNSVDDCERLNNDNSELSVFSDDMPVTIKTCVIS